MLFRYTGLGYGTSALGDEFKLSLSLTDEYPMKTVIRISRLLTLIASTTLNGPAQCTFETQRCYELEIQINYTMYTSLDIFTHGILICKALRWDVIVGKVVSFNQSRLSSEFLLAIVSLVS